MCFLVRYVFGLKCLKNGLWVGMCLLVRYMFGLKCLKNGLWVGMCLLVRYVYGMCSMCVSALVELLDSSISTYGHVKKSLSTSYKLEHTSPQVRRSFQT